MFDEIIAPNTEGEDGNGTDNMTAILVKLFNDDLAPLTGWVAGLKVNYRWLMKLIFGGLLSSGWLNFPIKVIINEYFFGKFVLLSF